MMNAGQKAPLCRARASPFSPGPLLPSQMLTALSHRGILMQEPTASPGSLKGDGHAGKAEDHGWSLGPSEPNTHRAVEQQ